MNEKIKIDIGSLVMWIGIILILGWAVLKILGVIQSPVWMEVIPYVGIGFSLAGGAYKFGKRMENIDRRLERTEDKITNLSRDFQDMREDFVKVRHNQILCMNGKLSHSPFRKVIR